MHAAGFDDPAVFSVDDRSVQVHWRGSVPGTLVVEAVDGPEGAPVACTSVDAAPAGSAATAGRSRQLSRLACGPGAAVVDGLRPARTYDLWVRSGSGRHHLGAVETLPRPPGELLGAFATVTDLHVGERRFGAFVRFEDAGYSVRALESAVTEAHAWGATHLVAKGDLTRNSAPVEFALAGQVLAGGGMPVDAVLGNHDQRRRRPGAWQAAAAAGVDLGTGVRVRDLHGLRLVLVTTTGDHGGHLPPATVAAAAEAAATEAICAVVVHHPPATTAIPLRYPPGIDRATSAALLRQLRAANPRAVVLAGHTHRHRLRWAHGVLCVETGSTKDYPGAWTGYRVYEGGIVQTTRRTASPRVTAFSEATRLALHGQWGRWSPGLLADRTFTLTWP